MFFTTNSLPKRRVSTHSFFILVLVLLLSGCGGPPGESSGQALIERRIQDQGKGNIKLVSFRKTNATGDDASYQLEYEAEIEFEADGAWTKGSDMAAAVSFEFSTQQAGQTATMGLMNSVLGTQNVRRGEHATVQGTIRFEKTENGWRGEDGQFY